jgi:hypothetical protein
VISYKKAEPANPHYPLWWISPELRNAQEFPESRAVRNGRQDNDRSQAGLLDRPTGQTNKNEVQPGTMPF